MKEKILATLKTRFTGVEDAILDRQAEKLAKTVEKEDQIDNAISGVTFGTLLQAETDRRTTEATSTAVKNYEKKHNLKDGKHIEDTAKKNNPEPPPKKGDDGEGGDAVPSWAKALTDKLDSYEQRLSQQEKERERSGKLSQAKEFLKASKIPDKLKDKWIKRVDVDDEETTLEDQVKALEDEYLELKQDHINSSVEGGEEHQGGETSDADLNEFLNEKFPVQEKTEK